MKLYLVMVHEIEDDGFYCNAVVESIFTTFEKARKKAAEVGNIEYLKLLDTGKKFYNDIGMGECEYA